MTYLSDRRRRKKRIVTIVIAGILFLLLVVYWKYTGAGIRFISTPFITGYSNVRSFVATIPSFFIHPSNKEQLKKISTLETTIERLENELASKNATLEEINTILSIKKEDAIDTPILILYPLIQDITNLYQTILLSKGFKDGVEIGDSVFIRGLQPVCIIKEVYTTSSLCELLSAPSKTLVGVLKNGSSTLTVTLTGRGGGTFLGDIPRDVEVVSGDRVYLEGDPSMILGTVTESIHNDQDTSWRVFIRGTYNPLTSHIFYIKK